MKKNFRYIAFLIVLLMALTVVPLTAFAADSKVELAFDAAQYTEDENGQVQVGFSITADSEIGGYYVEVEYDTTRLALNFGADTQNEEGLLILQGYAVSTKVTYNLIFDVIGDGNAGIRVKSAYVYKKTEDENDIFPLGDFPFAEITVGTGDDGAASFYDTTVAEDVATYEISLPYAAKVQAEDGDDIYILDLTRNDAEGITWDYELQTDTWKNEIVAYVSDADETVNLVCGADKDENVSIYAINCLSGDIYKTTNVKDSDGNEYICVPVGACKNAPDLAKKTESCVFAINSDGVGTYGSFDTDNVFHTLDTTSSKGGISTVTIILIAAVAVIFIIIVVLIVSIISAKRKEAKSRKNRRNKGEIKDMGHNRIRQIDDVDGFDDMDEDDEFYDSEDDYQDESDEDYDDEPEEDDYVEDEPVVEDDHVYERAQRRSRNLIRVPDDEFKDDMSIDITNDIESTSFVKKPRFYIDKEVDEANSSADDFRRVPTDDEMAEMGFEFISDEDFNDYKPKKESVAVDISEALENLEKPAAEPAEKVEEPKVEEQPKAEEKIETPEADDAAEVIEDIDFSEDGFDSKESLLDEISLDDIDMSFSEEQEKDKKDNKKSNDWFDNMTEI